MKIPVHFYSYFKDITGCTDTVIELPEGGDIAQLLAAACLRFPKLHSMGNSTLIAVGVNYQPKSYVLKEGDRVSLFPPVQGG